MTTCACSIKEPEIKVSPGEIKSEYSTNIPHYKQVILFQKGKEAELSPYSLCFKNKVTSFWSRTTEIKSSNHYVNNYYWKKQEELIYYFNIDEKTDTPFACVMFRVKKINMNTGKTMYFRLELATPFLLKKYNIRL